MAFSLNLSAGWRDVLEMIKTINSWRGLMAVTVVLFHAGVDWIWNIAVTGVTFFFISSAFLLSMKHPFERLRPSDCGRFVLDHALRLYPLHWLALAALVAITLLFHTSTVNWTATALSALLVQAWSPVHDIHYGLNPGAWYLSALLFCYAIYPLVAHWVGRWTLTMQVALIALLAALLAWILVPLDIPGREAVFVNPLSHVLDVVVGVTLFHVYRLLKARFPRVGPGVATLVEGGALLSLALAIGINVTTTWVKPWEDVLIWLLPQGAILVTLAFLDGQEGLVGRVLLWRPLQWLGSISFEVYVLQFVAFLMFNYMLAPLLGHFGWQVSNLLSWFAMVVLIPLSWLVNRYFTRPLASRLKNNRQLTTRGK